MVDYSRFAHIDDSSSDDDDVAMEHVKHVAREVLGRPGGPQQNIDEMLESGPRTTPYYRRRASTWVRESCAAWKKMKKCGSRVL